MSLTSGSRLGLYEILAPIGAGGMGEVYRARDTKLGREVAIKVLPESVSQDAEKLARFGREAHLLASVNHLNIATLYGLEESNGQQFLVMELVEGETLAERLVRGPMPVDEALPLFQHIAGGLETAHEKGIIHRDLKPLNIKITPEGVPKILDFGLAKALVEEGVVQDNSQSPTLTKDATGTGVLLGTAAYMSPEQARGKPVDKRTDIFSFGIVLYEALAGDSAFPGDDVSDVLASIIKLEPDWKALPSDLEPRLQNLLRRCLKKERKNRLQAIGDVRLEIQEILAGPLSVSTAGGMLKKIAWGLVVLLAIMAGVLAFTRVPPTLQRRFTRRASLALVDSNGSPLSPRALSLDNSGHTLVFSALGSEGTSLFLRRLDETETVPIPGTQGVVGVPAVSPDGTWVAFVVGQELKKVALGGGAPVSLHEMPKRPFGIAWVGNESLIFSGTQGLFLLPADGGSPERITTVETEGGELDHRWPYVTADGATLAYTVWSGSDDGRLRLRSLRTGIERTLTQGSSPRVTPTGRLSLERRRRRASLVPERRRALLPERRCPVRRSLHRQWRRLSTRRAAPTLRGDLPLSAAAKVVRRLSRRRAFLDDAKRGKRHARRFRRQLVRRAEAPRPDGVTKWK